MWIKIGGYRCADRDTQEWDGNFKAKKFIGDGSQLTGISSIPSGTIVLWHGAIASIPSGWAFCNGANGTPDLRNMFIPCATSDSGGIAKVDFGAGLNQTGGTAFHSHTFSFNLGAGTNLTDTSPTGDTANGNTGTTDAMTDMSVPYFTLAYIMKL